MRLFIAIDISDKAKKEIEKLYKVLKRKHWKVKWEEPEKLHLTLTFLGWVKKEEKVQLIKVACEKAVQFRPKDDQPLVEIKPFEVSFKGVGCFPDYDYPRVIWLGLKGDLKSLARLQKGIVSQLLGIKNDLGLEERVIKGLKRPFSSHITLGRIKKARTKERREIGRQLKKFRIMNYESRIKVDKVMIYESKLSRLGSKYKKLEEISLQEEN